jgi:hypothetical protein
LLQAHKRFGVASTQSIVEEATAQPDRKVRAMTVLRWRWARVGARGHVPSDAAGKIPPGIYGSRG